MDKPRHPQVICPWKTEQTQKSKCGVRAKRELRRQRGENVATPKFGRPSRASENPQAA
jgi:hypothetical protein